MSEGFRLFRDDAGRLVFVAADGTREEGVAPVRAFPVSAADFGFALVAADGRELAWIERLEGLPVDTRELLCEELESREFMPEIRRIVAVSSFATPSTWDVETERGTTRFVLRGEEDIRRLARDTLLIADSHGVQFLVRALSTLDRGSRRILDRFL